VNVVDPEKIRFVLKAALGLLIAVAGLTVLLAWRPNHVDLGIGCVLSARPMTSLTLHIPHRADIVRAARTSWLPSPSDMT